MEITEKKKKIALPPTESSHQKIWAATIPLTVRRRLQSVNAIKSQIA